MSEFGAANHQNNPLNTPIKQTTEFESTTINPGMYCHF
eukprot:CAMPEP_0172467470 /NCGR_PEP_ID=MMETSP1065-20121228/59027_1 /TAXON_ID=265537 /ORGANISM="Amphiprora paludosa, Strain CCMP125" /LENGTH=37 /DNA_ID= /DNA_START= /DNA_END= /DNA_ORIENTATION=